MPAGEAWTAQQRRAALNKYQRLYQHDGGTKVRNIAVPDDIEVRASDRPCFCCGASGACRHRLWLL